MSAERRFRKKSLPDLPFGYVGTAYTPRGSKAVLSIGGQFVGEVGQFEDDPESPNAPHMGIKGIIELDPEEVAEYFDGRLAELLETVDRETGRKRRQTERMEGIG